ncbi:EthD protein [Bordetella hinzii]|uniref:EthD domain-containing protein n=1 Tax=Bordetella hinzii TaxID=103855 RepID=UPI00040CAAEB|nr:EthD family reductase [Bordetella hinzii]AKQ56987.1 EthD protein [Bordetella hinzii]KCB25274.1 hypothetical protein L543_3694 [Bordetella hinzii L60]KCB51375.1 hypothetical protein L537_0826 [Bordetella hinzii 1277]SNV67565.1 EthD protein [Bordetella hinzii]
MYKVITLLKRRPGMSVADFQSGWREAHGPLASQAPGLRRYVQSHALPQGYAKGELIYDGISEMWFDDAAAHARAQASAWGEACRRDLARYAAGPVEMAVEVKLIVDGPIPAGGVKNIEFVNCRPGMALPDFRHYWEHRHGPLAAGIALMRRYEQNHLRLEAYRGGRRPPFDGLAITWFDSTADMKAGTRTEIYARTRADEANFLPDGHLPFIVTREHRMAG